ncbi:MAG TPA: LysR substrate-binding domain-containing protein [Catalimonadaceae bacterium]|nr:LysR substrate-binding domain-containing protein [Catalimonadaceae bacterium]
MHYTLHQLRIFHCVSQTQSITKAAEILHLTQPAVSIQLKNFQDQFPIPLTEVVGRKLFITDFGKEIALAAEKIMGEMEAISYKSRAFQGELSGKLTLSVVSTGQYVMPYFLADFMNAHPGVELVLDVTNKSQVLASLEANQVDFSLVSVLPEKLLIDSVSLLPNKLYLVSGAGMQFDKPEYDGSLLNELPLIFREAGSGTRLVIEHYLQRNGITVRKKMELTSNEAVKQAVLAGLGVSIMPLIGIRHELELKLLQIIPVKGFPIVSNWNLIWLKSKRFSPVAHAFLDFIQAEKDRIVAEKFDWFVE